VRAGPLLGWVAATLIGCNAAPAPTPAPAPSPSVSAPAPAIQGLRFLGTIVSIEPAPLPETTKRWIVTARVDRVLEGSFTGSSFAFRIHSPSRAGLAVGQQREIRAEAVDGGFAADELQWLGR
jgi:hypothetical protein